MKVRIICAGVLAAVFLSVSIHHSGGHINNSTQPTTRGQIATPSEPETQRTRAPIQQDKRDEKVAVKTETELKPETAVNVQTSIKASEPEPQPVPAAPKDIAKAKAAQRGWVGAEWNALVDLWHKESGWNPTANNKDSGACGIPQAYPCSKIPNPKSVESQIDWGLEYIASRYDTPSKALAFWKYEAPKYNGENWY